MAFTGHEEHEITLEQASKLTGNFRKARPGAVRAHFFGRDIFEKILAQEGCVGIRIHYGFDDNEKPQLVLVGADKDEKDLYDGIFGEVSAPCPPFCGPPNSPLNS